MIKLGEFVWRCPTPDCPRPAMVTGGTREAVEAEVERVSKNATCIGCGSRIMNRVTGLKLLGLWWREIKLWLQEWI